MTQGTLVANPTSLAFGSVQVGSSTSLSETLTNSGGTSLTISAAAASGAGFSLSGLTVPLTLNAGQSTSFTVRFSPTTSGAASGNVSITSNGSNPNLSTPLSGTGVTQGDLIANPASIAFGSIQDGAGAIEVNCSKLSVGHVSFYVNHRREVEDRVTFAHRF